MSAQLKSPFDPVVANIERNPEYLTPEHAEKLVRILRQHYPAVIDPDGEKKPEEMSPKELMRETIKQLRETIQKMNSGTSLFGDNGQVDSAALKRIVDSQDKLVKTLIKVGDELSTMERQEALEAAVSEALEATENKPLQEAFLQLFHAKLAEKSKKMGNFA